MTTLLIKNGLVIDPANKVNKTANVFVKNGKIISVGPKSPKANKTINAKGLVVTPGLIDMHVHLREPGNEDEETIASGANAAINGGFATIACMPNTDPPVDTEAAVEFVHLQRKRTNKANVFPIGAVTKGRKGEELAEIGQLVRGGAVAFSDDGDAIYNAEVMRRGLEYASMFDKAVIAHCENKDLAKNGVMNEGYISTVLGLIGIPKVAEELMVYRDIYLAKLTDAKVHIAHVSTAGAVDIIRKAKAEGIKVTAEVTPHHLTLTDDMIKTEFGGFNTNLKMNPPLRTEEDRKALIKGLKERVIDVIASDHAPHTSEKKDVEFNIAPFGIIGLETVLPIILTKLVHKKIISLAEIIAKLTINPARILGIKKGTLTPGADADITIIDLNKQWTINPDEFKSKSRNCPFTGWKVKGKAVKVIIAGQIISSN